MRIKILLLAALLFAPILLWAQVEEVDNTEYENYELDSMDASMLYMAPQYGKLRSLISDSKSDLYYPTLVKMFAKADTSMRFDQVHCFYYGSVFQNWYSPYYHSDEEEQALELLNQEQLSKKDAKKVIKLMNKAIKKVPTHLRLYLYRWVAESVLYGRDSKQAQDDSYRYSALIEVIGGSGNGVDAESAFYVTMVQHSYELMSAYGFTPTSQRLETYKGQSYDVFPLEDNEYDVEEFYFNVNPCLLFWSDLLADADVSSSDAEDGTLASMTWSGDTTSISVSMENKPGEYTIGLGSRVVIELGEPDENGVYDFQVVSIDMFNDTLVTGNDSLLFSAQEPSNRIVFYLAPGKLSSDNSYTFLTLKSYFPEMLSYDTYVLYKGARQFETTSNMGLFPNVRGNEMWHGVVTAIKIANIRKQ